MNIGFSIDRNKTMGLMLAILLCSKEFTRESQACSAFMLEYGQQKLIGKSYDWDFGNGMAVVNPKGVAKRSFPYNPKDRPAEWISNHGSITFNQYGRELPNGGMNDEGLVVEILWLDQSQYPPPDERPVVSELQWIQYQLDNFSSVKEMVDQAPKLRLSSVYAKVHYFVADRTGDCAVFEFLHGSLVVTTGKKLVTKAITNNTYTDSVNFLKKHRGFGGKLPIPEGPASLNRFARVAWGLGKKLPKNPDLEARAFEIIDSVRQGDFTKWQIVYDPEALEVHFRTLGHESIKSLAFKHFDTNCNQPVHILNMNIDSSGEVSSKFTDYSSEANVAYSRESWKGIVGNFPPNMVQMLMGFFESFPCKAAATGQETKSPRTDVP